MMQAAPQDPNRQAEVQALAVKTGIPAEVVDRNYDAIKARALITDTPYSQMMRETPNLAQWLTNPANAAIAKDDLPTLGYIESAIQKLEDVTRDAVSGIVSGTGKAISGAAVIADILHRNLQPVFGSPTDAAVQGTLGDSGKGLPVTPPGTALPVNPADTQGPWWSGPVNVLSGAGGVVQKAGKAALPPIERQGLTSEIVSGLGQLVPLLAASFVAGPEASAAMFVGQGAADTSDATATADVAQKNKDLATVLGGAISGFTGEYGLNTLLERVPVQLQSAVLTKVLDVATAGGIQAAQAFTQQLLDGVTQRVLINPDAPLLPSARELGVAGAVGVSARMLLGAAGMIKVGSHFKEQQQTLTDIGAALKESKAFERAPEAVQQLFKSATVNGPLEHVYLPIDSFTQHFQEAGTDPAQAAAAITPDGAERYQQATETGADIQLPFADYLANVAGKEHADFFNKEVRFQPDEANANEGAAFAEQMKAEQAQLAQTPVDEPATMPAPMPDTPQVDGQFDGQFTTVYHGTRFDSLPDLIEWIRNPQARPDTFGGKGSLDVTETPELAARYANAQVTREPSLKFEAQKPGTAVVEIKVPRPIEWQRRGDDYAESLDAVEARLGPEERGLALGKISVAADPYSVEHALIRGSDLHVLQPDPALADKEFGGFRIKTLLDSMGLGDRLQIAEKGSASMRDRSGEKPLRATPPAESNPLFSDKLIASLDTLANDAWDRIQKRGTLTGTRLGSALPVDDLADLVVYGAAKLTKAGIRFTDWSIDMVKDFGEAIKPRLSDIYAKSMAMMAGLPEFKGKDLKPVFMSQEQSGLSDENWQAYQSTLADASAKSRDAITQKLQETMQRERSSWWMDERDKVREQVAQQVHDQPVYKALDELKPPKPADGTEAPAGFKLDLNEIKRRFGKDSETTNQLKKLGVARLEGGVSLDVAAEQLGYNSGQELAKDLATADPADRTIDIQTDAEMNRRHGNMILDGTLPDESKKAVIANDRDIVVRSEMRALKAKQREVQPFVRAAADQQANTRQTGMEALQSGIPSKEQNAKLATDLLNATTVGDLRPDRYWAAAGKASNDGAEAVSKGKYDKALQAKQKELLNLEMYRQANAAKDSLQDFSDNAKKMFRPDEGIAKTRNMDFVAAARSIAATFLFEGKSDDAATALSKIKEYDPSTYEILADRIDAATEDLKDPATGKPKAFRDLTLGEAQGVLQAVDGLWKLARRSEQILIDGKLVDKQERIAGVVPKLEALRWSDTPPGTAHAVTPGEEAHMFALGLVSRWRRVESWADAVDGDDPAKPMRSLIFTPLSEAADAYALRKVAELGKYHTETVQPLEDLMSRDKIPAPELGYTFNGMSELLGAILHTGNESNLSKLLRGRTDASGAKWGAYRPDGTVDTSRWDAFVERAQADGTITKEHYDYAQRVWDQFESLKPELQKAYNEMHGTYFDEVQASPVHTPWGDYRGGYMPARVDPWISADAQIRQDNQNLNQGGANYSLPTTGTGATKARFEAYAGPLALDIGFVPSHIDWALRFMYLEPRVKDIGRIVMDRTFRAALDQHNPDAAAAMLIPYLKRTASQRITDPWRGFGGKAIDKAARWVRSSSSLQIMAFNLSNTIQQLHGASMALAKVEPGHLASALWQYARSPHETSEWIAEHSDYMKMAFAPEAMDLQRSIDRIIDPSSKLETAQEFFQEHGYFLQRATHGIIRKIIYTGAYNQALDHQGAGAFDEAAANREAEAAVRQTTVSHRPMDMSYAETGMEASEMGRVVMMFSSFFNTQANLQGTEWVKQAQRDAGLSKNLGRGLYLAAVTSVLPAAMVAMSQRLFNGSPQKDNKTPEDNLLDYGSMFLGSQVKSMLAEIPGGSVAMGLAAGLASIGTAAVGGKSKDFGSTDIRMSPAINMLERASAAVGEAGVYAVRKMQHKDGEPPIRDVFDLLGILSSLPLGPVGKPIKYMHDVSTGKARKPHDVVEAAKGLASGQGPIV